MKRILLLAVIFFILTPQVGARGSSSFQVIDGILPNGGFESNPFDPSNGWDWPANNWEWDAGISHQGAHSAKVTRFSGEETSSLWSKPINVQTSSIYTLSFWLRTTNASKNPSVVIYQYSSKDVQTGPRQVAYSNVGSGTNDWMLTSFRFQTMPDVSYIQLRIYLYTDTSGTFWFDDFDLVENQPALFPFAAGFPVEASGWVYMSSPSVADINHDSKNELLIGAGNSLDGWDYSGSPLPGYPVSTSGRYIYNQLALADLDSDSRLEILAGTRTANPPEGQCQVYAWKDDGSLLYGWPVSVDWNPNYSNNDCKVTSIVLADIDGNHQQEVLASTTNNASGNPGSGIIPQNLYAWHADGSKVSGNWPSKLTAAGFYGAIAAGDLNNDGTADVIAARDHHMLNVYAGNGVQFYGWPVKTFLDSNQGDYQSDYRVVYGRSAPVLADLDNNGSEEYIVLGNVTGPGSNTDILNTALLVLNKDGTRYPGWELPALGSGVLTQDDLPQLSPAIGDINADGLPEIVAATLDGWIRAYDLHKNVLWAFNFSQGAPLFATEPVIGDIDGDFALEVLFGTYVPITGNDYGGPVGLWSIDGDGSVSSGFPLPIPSPGLEATPTLADLDGDGKVDILAATVMGDVFVWDTPNPMYPARFPWPVGRHDLQRTAEYIDPRAFGKSQLTGAPYSVKHGDTAAFSIDISSLTPIVDTITVTDTLPSGLSIVPGSLVASSGTVTEQHGIIRWSGTLPKNLSVNISYQVFVETDKPLFMVNTLLIDTTIEGILHREAYLSANTVPTYLPSIHR